ncbi:hypothetical protein [Heyndrickxia vini]|uniref:Flagellar hook-length control protein FliK n=1 Tax=Heyndrickxia vini TaxID=1476025 RepID=A0ABX7DYC6_9BACI|nr:hypothetical protein [Heyndrickxia vini]QQZ07961.1 hypothetical protein I5776_12790 [Heyndrickxia vini]
MILSNIQSILRGDVKPLQNLFEFQSGDIFVGNISKIYPNQTAVVKVGNQNILAKLEAPIINGGKYWFQASTKEGEIHLKILSSVSTESQTQNSILKQLSLPNSKVFKELTAFLAKEQIPLPKETILRVGEWIEHQQNTKEGLDTLKYMVEKDYPFSESIYKSLREALSPKSPIQTLLNDLETQLNAEPKTKTVQSLLSAIESLQPKNVEANSKENIPQNLLSIIKATTSKMGLLFNSDIITNTNNEIITESNIKPLLVKYIQETDHSLVAKKLAEQFINQTNEQKLLSVVQSLQSEDLETNKNTLPQNLLTLLKKTTSKMGLFYEADILANKEGKINLENSMKPLLVKYVQETDHSLETKELAEQIINKMNGQQLLSNSNTPYQHIVYQMPFQLFGFQTELTMQWSGKRKEDGKIDPDFCHVLFYLELENLQETIVDMKVQNRIISMKVINSNIDHLQEMAQSIIPKLKTGLKDLNYSLSSIQFESSTNNEVQKSFSKPVKYQYSGVDIRI